MKPNTGQPAPDFSTLDQHGNIVTLSQFRGKKVLLYFYPKDNTPGCTAQACDLRDNFAVLRQKGIVVLGVSMDTVKKHRSFADKLHLPFVLLADTERKIIDMYGVWGPKKFMGRLFNGILRTSFLIDEQGIIVHIIDKVKTKEHTAQVLAFWE